MNTDYENLCFEGGGMLGYAYIGAIQALEDRKILSGFKRFSGTSIGSLFATLLACNFTANDISDLYNDIEFKQLSVNFSICNLYNIWNKYGINSLSILEDQLRKILSKKVDPNITFLELYKLTGKELVVVSCCINKQTAVYFHHAIYPNVKILDAMVSSMAVPFVFQPRKNNYLVDDDYYVDGGMVDNYPIWIWNDLNKLYENRLYEVIKEEIPEKTLGLKLLARDEKNTVNVICERQKCKSVFSYTTCMLFTMLRQIEKVNISESYINQTIPINTGDAYFLDFEMSNEKKQWLIDSGKESVLNYLRVRVK